MKSGDLEARHYESEYYNTIWREMVGIGNLLCVLFLRSRPDLIFSGEVRRHLLQSLKIEKDNKLIAACLLPEST